ncbi:MAG TPA: 23S rRNA (pseudouridine(1915)-N(3))-methyltransferase RlmH [Terracidiphilus sp.]|nr:23S rRNA (pseudouridine(1915)-N(3))-methyltransferase RlmH [Terracidiphilus sp.]
MQLTLAHIGARPNARDPLDALTADFLARCSILAPAQSRAQSAAQAHAFRTEQALLEWLDRAPGRTRPLAVLLDSRGRQFTSETFAAWLGCQRDQGARHILFAVGPASGWSPAARERAQLLLSLGPLTLAHALARLVLAEQLYRAATILTGHPYHTGH